MNRITFILTALLALPQSALARLPPDRVDEWDKTYDAHFRKYAKRYFGPHFDWRWFKSQGIAESGLDPDAVSSAGARGLMQVLPSTYKEIRKLNPHYGESHQPRWNIAAGIYYDRQLYNKWRTPPAGTERLFYSFGSYNAGYRRVYRALKRLSGEHAGTWDEITRFVPSQTHHYVLRIKRLMSAPEESTASVEQ